MAMTSPDVIPPDLSATIQDALRGIDAARQARATGPTRKTNPFLEAGKKVAGGTVGLLKSSATHYLESINPLHNKDLRFYAAGGLTALAGTALVYALPDGPQHLWMIPVSAGVVKGVATSAVSGILSYSKYRGYLSDVQSRAASVGEAEISKAEGITSRENQALRIEQFAQAARQLARQKNRLKSMPPDEFHQRLNDMATKFILGEEASNPNAQFRPPDVTQRLQQTREASIKEVVEAFDEKLRDREAKYTLFKSRMASFAGGVAAINLGLNVTNLAIYKFTGEGLGQRTHKLWNAARQGWEHMMEPKPPIAVAEHATNTPTAGPTVKPAETSTTAPTTEPYSTATTAPTKTPVPTRTPIPSPTHTEIPASPTAEPTGTPTLEPTPTTPPVPSATPDIPTPTPEPTIAVPPPPEIEVPPVSVEADLHAGAPAAVPDMDVSLPSAEVVAPPIVVPPAAPTVGVFDAATSPVEPDVSDAGIPLPAEVPSVDNPVTLDGATQRAMDAWQQAQEAGNLPQFDAETIARATEVGAHAQAIDLSTNDGVQEALRILQENGLGNPSEETVRHVQERILHLAEDLANNPDLPSAATDPSAYSEAYTNLLSAHLDEFHTVARQVLIESQPAALEQLTSFQSYPGTFDTLSLLQAASQQGLNLDIIQKGIGGETAKILGTIYGGLDTPKPHISYIDTDDWSNRLASTLKIGDRSEVEAFVKWVGVSQENAANVLDRLLSGDKVMFNEMVQALGGTSPEKRAVMERVIEAASRNDPDAIKILNAIGHWKRSGSLNVPTNIRLLLEYKYGLTI